jgi:hypothetical protein
MSLSAPQGGNSRFPPVDVRLDAASGEIAVRRPPKKEKKNNAAFSSEHAQQEIRECDDASS